MTRVKLAIMMVMMTIILSACVGTTGNPFDQPIATAVPAPTATQVAVAVAPVAPAVVVPAPVAVAPVQVGPAIVAPAPAPTVAVAQNPSIPQTVSVIPDNTLVASGTLVVVRVTDFGKKTVSVTAGTLPQPVTFGVNGDIHTDGWWGFGSQTRAVEGACKEVSELNSHISKIGDTWYQFTVTSNCTQVTSAPAPASSSITNSGGLLLRRPNEGFTTLYVPPTNQPDPVQARRKHITGAVDDGVSNVWVGGQLDLRPLADLKKDEMYLAHGDLVGNGGCQVWYWLEGSRPSRPIVSAATWQLYHVQGVSKETLEDAAAVAQLIAGFRDIPSCVVTRKG